MLSLIGKTVPPKPMEGDDEEALAHSKNNFRAGELPLSLCEVASDLQCSWEEVKELMKQKPKK